MVKTSRSRSCDRVYSLHRETRLRPVGDSEEEDDSEDREGSAAGQEGRGQHNKKDSTVYSTASQRRTHDE
jgi:hypothetical protein